MEKTPTPAARARAKAIAADARTDGEADADASIKAQGLILAELDYCVSTLRPFLLLWVLIFASVSWLVQGYVSTSHFVAWLAAYTAVLAAGTAVLQVYRRQGEPARLRCLPRWIVCFGTLNAVHGLIWGSLAWFALPDLPLFRQIILTWIVALSGALAAVVTPTSVISLRLYLALALGPTLAAWVSAGGQESWLVAVSMAVLGVVYDAVGRRHSRDLRERFSYAAELTKANHMLEASNVSKTRLIVEASHDLRQPVHAMGMMLERVNIDGPRAELACRLQDIQACLNNVSDMLVDLLDLSRLETGQYVMDVQPVDVGRLLAGLEQTFKPLAQRKRLNWVVSNPRAWVLSDPAMLRRIMNNLISNAIKYTAEGGVAVACRVTGTGVELRVSDTGQGIPPHQLEAIFQEYVRLDVASQEPGYGIGLSVVRRMADLLGHPLAVKSRVGYGSRFALSLQRVEAPPMDEHEPVLPHLVDQHNITGKLIVFIENDELLRNSTAEVLRSWGAEVLIGVNLAELKNQMDALGMQPDLIISDMHLGEEIDGLGAIEALRRHYHPEPLPAILLTGDLKPELQARSRASDIRIAYKPVRPARLKELISNAMSGQRNSEPMTMF